MMIHSEIHMLEEAALALIPLLTSGIPSFLLEVAAYVLTSMALYTLATRRGLEKAWLSWVPVLNVWIIGSLSDQYRYVVKGQDKSKRKILLILNLVNLLLGLIFIVAVVVMAADLIRGAVYGVPEAELIRSALAPVLSIAGLCLPMAGVGIAAAVIRYMALYDIYTSMDPGNSVMFLVLSILFGITEPVFLFVGRNRDDGMPPRKEAPQPEPWQDTVEF